MRLPMMMFITAELSRKLCARGSRILEDMCLPKSTMLLV
jgi:hypothetical protein